MQTQEIPELTSVSVDDEFWSPRRQVNREITLDVGYQQLIESGRFENLRRAVEGTREDQQLALENRMYRDESDIYKWLEAASYAMAVQSTPDLEAKVDYAISLLEDAQQDDGYLNSYFSLYAPEDRWSNLGVMHELYSAGHLFEAAVAHYEATGERRLLDVATAFADHIDDVFGDGGGAPGHQEAELGLVKLYRATGERRYLELAETFLDERGHEDSPFRREVENLDSVHGTEAMEESYRRLFLDEDSEYDGKYVQDHAPVREQLTAVGHAVRATYMYAAMADVAMETGDEELIAALERIWTNTVQKRMYITGGLGSSHENEGFTSDYDLSNDTAYAETCASIGNILWNHRMLQLTGEGKYGDLMERTLYNGFLAGVSLDGTRFFYANPLASDGDRHPLEHVSEVRFTLQRQKWFNTPCCPPNVARFLGSLEKYVYFLDDGAVSINLYVGGAVQTTIDDSEVTITQETNYPWDDVVEIDISTDDSVTIALRPRVPNWCQDPVFTVNGDSVSPDVSNGFAEIERTWEDGDKLTVELPMPVTQVDAHPELTAAAGRVALERGPVVYCFEGVDNEVPLENVCVPSDTEFSATFEKNTLGGVVLLRGDVTVTETDYSDDSLYRPRKEAAHETASMTAIPYYAWANRSKSEMRVWMRACDCPH
jgi:DUF1680 family protein